VHALHQVLHSFFNLHSFTLAMPDVWAGFQVNLRMMVIAEALVLLNPLVTSRRLKVWLLRRFGAQIGTGLNIKPNVHVKHPWRLQIGDNVWLGERAWLDNLVEVRLGSNVCLSQGAYLCTGNHDWSDPGMGMMSRPITVEDGAWVGAFARIGPGVTVGREAVLAMGAVLVSDAEPRGIYAGNPAERVGTRHLRPYPGPARSVAAV